MSVTKIAEKLEIDKIKDRKYVSQISQVETSSFHLCFAADIQGTSGRNGKGLYEGLSWIQKSLTQKELQESVVKPLKEVTSPLGKPNSHTWWSTISTYFVRAS